MSEVPRDVGRSAVTGGICPTTTVVVLVSLPPVDDEVVVLVVQRGDGRSARGGAVRGDVCDLNGAAQRTADRRRRKYSRREAGPRFRLSWLGPSTRSVLVPVGVENIWWGGMDPVYRSVSRVQSA